MIGKPNRPGFRALTPYLMAEDMDAGHGRSLAAGARERMAPAPIAMMPELLEEL